jgi:hypothetical protein
MPDQVVISVYNIRFADNHIIHPTCVIQAATQEHALDASRFPSMSNATS